MRRAQATIAGADRTGLALPAFLLVGLMAIAACTVTPAQRDEREYRRLEFEDRFIDFRRRCWARGGRVVIDAKQSLRRGNIPHRGDRYICA